MKICKNSNLMLSTSLVALTFTLSPCSSQATILKNTFSEAADNPISLVKPQLEYRDTQGIFLDIKEVDISQAQLHLKPYIAIENSKDSVEKQITSYDLIKTLDPTYRRDLFNIANEINPSVLNKAMGYIEDEGQLPTQAFGDIIRFTDSFDNGNTWQNVFADSGR